ncbi:uncharacterized protein LOC130229016 isoform X2 [Danio aesculapii]|uniref:uncharacterized protein LOC130229016 isoform X2 n=1 Tax=Danio aesculapii TaxID=1142201 RepID=UPI0024C0364A|nr:uncharacterized protein LOC130229016 isoform X2 [Danio aesculapii]
MYFHCSIRYQLMTMMMMQRESETDTKTSPDQSAPHLNKLFETKKMTKASKDEFQLVLEEADRENVEQEFTVPCHLSPQISAVDMEIRWFKETECVFLYKKRKLLVGRSYRGRVNLLTEHLEGGNVSLYLRDFRQSDVGDYVCQVTSGDTTEETTVKVGYNLWKGALAAGALAAAGVAIAVQAAAAATDAKATAKSSVAPRVIIQGRATAPLAEATAKALVAEGGAAEKAQIAGTTIAILLFLFLLGATVVLALVGARRNGARTTRKTSRPVGIVAEVATNCWKFTVRQFLKTYMAHRTWSEEERSKMRESSLLAVRRNSKDSNPDMCEEPFQNSSSEHEDMEPQN